MSDSNEERMNDTEGEASSIDRGGGDPALCITSDEVNYLVFR